MYLFYFLILCDISLILASDQYFFYDVEDSSSSLPWRTDSTAYDFQPYSGRQKRESNTTYNESTNITLQMHPHTGANSNVVVTDGKSEPPVKVIASSTVSSLPPSLNLSTHQIPTIKEPVSVHHDQYSTSTDVSGTNETRNKTKSGVPLNESATVVTHESYPGDITNDTLKQHNITRKSEDSHVYYTSWMSTDPKVGMSYWVDMNNRSDTIVHQMLSHSYRRAVTVLLGFKFQFYGHEIENVTIATGGFLYTGDYIHSWLAATQYIAPLMANFDTSLSNDSFIKYVHNDTTFTVMWENVALQDRPHAGNFTFQVTLCKSGDIIFVYKHIANITNELTEDYHPVKVGLSDAYILDRTIFFVRRKTIFEYHRVHFEKKDVRNWTTIYLKPLPTCQNKTTCESCSNKDSHFDCQWCDGRCSTGVDRKRQDWVKQDCERKKINETKYCSLANEKVPTPGAHKSMNYNEGMPKSNGGSSSAMFLFVIAIVCVFAAFVWTMYAYRNPHSTSGQILIRYRPSQWSGWRKGEARYTAATIHM